MILSRNLRSREKIWFGVNLSQSKPALNYVATALECVCVCVCCLPESQWWSL